MYYTLQCGKVVNCRNSVFFLSVFRYIADLQISEACKTFVREYGDKIVQEKLCRNFILHLVNLNDFNILGKAQLLQTIELLDEIRYPPE